MSVVLGGVDRSMIPSGFKAGCALSPDGGLTCGSLIPGAACSKPEIGSLLLSEQCWHPSLLAAWRVLNSDLKGKEKHFVIGP